MGDIIWILLTIGIVSYICSIIYHTLKEKFPLLWFIIYIGGTVVVVLWFAKYGAIGQISQKIIEPLIIFLIAPFFGNIFGIFFLPLLGLFGLIFSGVLGLSGSVSEMLGLGSFDGYQRHKETGERRRREPIANSVRKVSEKAMYGKNYKNPDDDKYEDY